MFHEIYVFQPLKAIMSILRDQNFNKNTSLKPQLCHIVDIILCNTKYIR